MARWGGAAAVACALCPAPGSGQIPERFENLQALPTDIARDSLVEIMRGFSFALGVRCQYCHVGGDGVSFDGVVFSSDDDPDKVKARRMIEMVRDLNDVVLAALPERDSPPISVECKTCHRGQSRPTLLRDELRRALDSFGPDSAVARYERWAGDESILQGGYFDFGEWEVNVLAERLEREGRLSDAIAIYELNGRHHGESASIEMSLGGLHEEVGDTAAAVRNYERVLELAPGFTRAQVRLDSIRGRGSP